MVVTDPGALFSGHLSFGQGNYSLLTQAPLEIPALCSETLVFSWWAMFSFLPKVVLRWLGKRPLCAASTVCEII